MASTTRTEKIDEMTRSTFGSIDSPNARLALYIASAMGASVAYISNVIAFTGSFDAFPWLVFVAVFLGFTYGFERFINWHTEDETHL